jgi:hypothetical protein
MARGGLFVVDRREQDDRQIAECLQLATGQSRRVGHSDVDDRQVQQSLGSDVRERRIGQPQLDRTTNSSDARRSGACRARRRRRGSVWRGTSGTFSGG